MRKIVSSEYRPLILTTKSVHAYESPPAADDPKTRDITQSGNYSIVAGSKASVSIDQSVFMIDRSLHSTLRFRYNYITSGGQTFKPEKESASRDFSLIRGAYRLAAYSEQRDAVFVVLALRRDGKIVAHFNSFDHDFSAFSLWDAGEGWEYTDIESLGSLVFGVRRHLASGRQYLGVFHPNAKQDGVDGSAIGAEVALATDEDNFTVLSAAYGRGNELQTDEGDKRRGYPDTYPIVTDVPDSNPLRTQTTNTPGGNYNSLIFNKNNWSDLPALAAGSADKVGVIFDRKNGRAFVIDKNGNEFYAAVDLTTDDNIWFGGDRLLIRPGHALDIIAVAEKRNANDAILALKRKIAGGEYGDIGDVTEFNGAQIVNQEYLPEVSVTNSLGVSLQEGSNGFTVQVTDPRETASAGVEFIVESATAAEVERRTGAGTAEIVSIGGESVIGDPTAVTVETASYILTRYDISSQFASFRVTLQPGVSPPSGEVVIRFRTPQGLLTTRVTFSGISYQADPVTVTVGNTEITLALAPTSSLASWEVTATGAFRTLELTKFPEFGSSGSPTTITFSAAGAGVETNQSSSAATGTFTALTAVTTPLRDEKVQVVAFYWRPNYAAATNPHDHGFFIGTDNNIPNGLTVGRENNKVYISTESSAGWSHKSSDAWGNALAIHNAAPDEWDGSAVVSANKVVRAQMQTGFPEKTFAIGEDDENVGRGVLMSYQLRTAHKDSSNNPDQRIGGATLFNVRAMGYGFSVRTDGDDNLRVMIRDPAGDETAFGSTHSVQEIAEADGNTNGFAFAIVRETTTSVRLILSVDGQLFENSSYQLPNGDSFANDELEDLELYGATDERNAGLVANIFNAAIQSVPAPLYQRATDTISVLRAQGPLQFNSIFNTNKSSINDQSGLDLAIPGLRIADIGELLRFPTEPTVRDNGDEVTFPLISSPMCSIVGPEISVTSLGEDGGFQYPNKISEFFIRTEGTSPDTQVKIYGKDQREIESRVFPDFNYRLERVQVGNPQKDIAGKSLIRAANQLYLPEVYYGDGRAWEIFYEGRTSSKSRWLRF